MKGDFIVCLDACVLCPPALCDILLRLAEHPRLYRPVFSTEILAEVKRTVPLFAAEVADDLGWELKSSQSAASDHAPQLIPEKMILRITARNGKPTWPKNTGKCFFGFRNSHPRQKIFR